MINRVLASDLHASLAGHTVGLRLRRRPRTTTDDPLLFTALLSSLFLKAVLTLYPTMALTATAQSAFPREPGWDDIIVPALRKREHSCTLETRYAV